MYQISLYNNYYAGHWNSKLHGDIRVHYSSLDGRTGFVEDYVWEAPDAVILDWDRDGSSIPFFPHVVAAGSVQMRRRG